MKTILTILLVLLSLNVFSIGHGRTGIGNIRFNDDYEYLIKKIEDQNCKTVTIDSDEKTITGIGYSFTYNPLHRITGDIKVYLTRRNRIMYIEFIPYHIKEAEKYVNFLNKKYFPNIDSDRKWWDYHRTITKSRNYTFKYSK